MSQSFSASNPAAETVDALSPDESSGTNLRPRVHLVEGSGDHLSGETHVLLRARLRAAAIVLCVGFTAFFVWGFFDQRWETELAHRFAPQLIFWMQAAVMVALGAMGFLLCNRCSLCMSTLRTAELFIFGLPAVFFFTLYLVTLPFAAKEYHVLPAEMEAWMMLIFTYALFVPNTWKRAAIVVGVMAVTPLVLRMILITTNESCASAVGGDWFSLGSLTILMSLTAFAATLGVHTINSLRVAAFRARKMGQYHLKQMIGSGGMGEVYLAEHLLMKRPCAVKIIRPEKAGDPTVLARFEREVRASAKLSHWNTIDIYDYGRADDGTFYYAMEYLPGLSLQDLVSRFGPLPPARVIYLVRQVCDALQEAHGVGLIHRDIKPANIFAAHRGGLHDVGKLLDFGLAKPLTASEDGDPNLTQTGTVTGSPLYMSPEQATGDYEPDERSDIYSLGAVMYFLLTGKPPFESDKPLKVLVAHASTPPLPPRELQPEIPEDVEQVVLRCLAKKPAERFQSAAQLAQALDARESAGRWTRQDAEQWWLAIGDATPALPEAILA
jgi:serine/threonine-protein kinase